MNALSWDLHIHPGLPEEGRWGDGAQVQRAAERAGVTGFVWKSHSGVGTQDACAELPRQAPWAMPSITLNTGVSPGDLARALTAGVRWVWGPSRHPDGALGWDLPLPARWPEMAQVLRDVGSPLVLCTSHLGPQGRAESAQLAHGQDNITSAVTHSLYLGDSEVQELAQLGALFEADLYTMFNPVRDVPMAPLADRARLCRSLGTSLYLTSDAGQRATGDPYEFVGRCLASLDLPLDLEEELTVAAPRSLAMQVFGEELAK